MPRNNAVVFIKLQVKFLQGVTRDHFDKLRVEFLGIRHNKIKDMRPNNLLVLIVVHLVKLGVPHREVVVHLNDLRVHADEVREDLLDFLVLEGFLDEPLKVITEVPVLLKCTLNLIKEPLRVSLVFKVQSIRVFGGLGLVFEVFLIQVELLQILLGIGLQLFLLPLVELFEHLPGELAQLITHHLAFGLVLLLIALIHKLFLVHALHQVHILMLQELLKHLVALTMEA